MKTKIFFPPLGFEFSYPEIVMPEVTKDNLISLRSYLYSNKDKVFYLARSVPKEMMVFGERWYDTRIPRSYKNCLISECNCNPMTVFLSGGTDE